MITIHNGFQVCLSTMSPLFGLHHIIEGKINRKTTRISTWELAVDQRRVIMHMIDFEVYNSHYMFVEDLIHDNYLEYK